MAFAILIEGTDRTANLEWGSLDFELSANHDDNCTVTLHTTAAGFMPAVGQDFQVDNGIEVIWGGIINEIDTQLYAPGLGTDKELLLRLRVLSYSSIATRRTTTIRSNNNTAAFIVNHVVSILASEGVAAGTINTGCSDCGEYDAVVKNCAEIMNDMCSLSGYQWYINADKQLMFFNWDLVVTITNELLESVGRTFTDFQIESHTQSLDQYANKIFIVGNADLGEVVVDQDDDEINARIAVEGGTGVYGAVIRDDSIWKVADANALIAATLKVTSIIPRKVVFTTMSDIDHFYPGFRIKMNLPSIGIATDTYFNIDKVQWYDDNGLLKCRCTCTVRKTSDFSGQMAQTGIEYLGKLVERANGAGTTINNTTIVDPDTGTIYTAGNVYVMEDFPPTAPDKSVLIDIGDPTIDDGLAAATTLTWASPKQVDAMGNVTPPDPTADKNILGAAIDHTGAVIFVIRNANAANGMVRVGDGLGGYLISLFPQQSCAIRTGIEQVWRLMQ